MQNSNEAIAYLTAQHRSLEQLLDRILEEEEASARRALFAKAGDALTVHMKSEEEVFYPAVRAARTEDILLESLEEHLSLKRLLADLLALDPMEKLFEPKFKVLKEQTEHHHKEEEKHLFPKVMKLMDSDQRELLGQQMAALQLALEQLGKPRDEVVHETAAAAPLQGDGLGPMRMPMH